MSIAEYLLSNGVEGEISGFKIAKPGSELRFGSARVNAEWFAFNGVVALSIEENIGDAPQGIVLDLESAKALSEYLGRTLREYGEVAN
jgi:hypothetical protein